MATENDVIKALSVMAQIMRGGERVNEEGAKALVEDLSEFHPDQILIALRACRKELTFFPTLNDITTRMQSSDGRPGIEEAWSMCPKDEYKSVYLNDEIMAAWGSANEILIETGDMIAARMAFKEVYERKTKEARSEGRKPGWFFSQGRDKLGRQSALRDAIEKKRLTVQEAQRMLPEFEMKPTTPLIGEDRRSATGMATLGDVIKNTIEVQAGMHKDLNTGENHGKKENEGKRET